MTAPTRRGARGGTTSGASGHRPGRSTARRCSRPRQRRCNSHTGPTRRGTGCSVAQPLVGRPAVKVLGGLAGLARTQADPEEKAYQSRPLRPVGGSEGVRLGDAARPGGLSACNRLQRTDSRLEWTRCKPCPGGHGVVKHGRKPPPRPISTTPREPATGAGCRASFGAGHVRAGPRRVRGIHAGHRAVVYRAHVPGVSRAIRVGRKAQRRSPPRISTSQGKDKSQTARGSRTASTRAAACRVLAKRG